MNKIRRNYQKPTKAITNFSDVFDSMEDEQLVEMALHYPQQLSHLCLFLTLDWQLAEEELSRSLVGYSN